MHPAVSKRQPTTSPASARISRSWPCRSTASRWSISTTPPRRRSRRRCSTACSTPTPHEYANVHRGLHYLANAATEAYEGAREKVRGFLNAGAARKRSSSPATPPRRSTSSPIPSAASGIKAGDEIVLSIMEHHSNIVPWHFLRERQGAVIKWAPVDDDGNFLHRRVREAARRRAPRWSRSRTCRTCSAPSCR